MINIQDKKDCCGCGACIQVCPKECISYNEDLEGFKYPSVNESICINCNLCTKVCPVINQNTEREPISVSAAKNIDDNIREESSSGGIFSLLAEKVINDNGIVFGARFNDEFNVIHDHITTMEKLELFRGSKYVQSDISYTFKRTKQFLIEGKKVLFCGTPCQISGLKRFLSEEYSNLLTIDFICHGIPSPKVWDIYKKGLLAKYQCGNKKSFFNNISFRDKSIGWDNFCFKAEINFGGQTQIVLEPFRKNIFMRGFLKDLYLRPSCYKCPSKNLKSGSDITLGDFWGIQKIFPKFDDDKGVSIVLCNTQKGTEEFNSLQLEAIPCSYEIGVESNSAIKKSAIENKHRKVFFEKLPSSNIEKLISKYTNISFTKRVKSKLKRIAKSLITKR